MRAGIRLAVAVLALGVLMAPGVPAPGGGSCCCPSPDPASCPGESAQCASLGVAQCCEAASRGLGSAAFQSANAPPLVGALPGRPVDQAETSLARAPERLDLVAILSPLRLSVVLRI